MIGNQAIARGLVEAGIELAAAYPGTPSSEILPGIVEFKRMEKKDIHTEWSTNEKCAFEVAFGAASIGKKAACFMKQAGLNVAFASLLKALEKPIDGGLVIVSCDDLGPQSFGKGNSTASPYSIQRLRRKQPMLLFMPSTIPLKIKNQSSSGQLIVWAMPVSPYPSIHPEHERSFLMKAFRFLILYLLQLSTTRYPLSTALWALLLPA